MPMPKISPYLNLDDARTALNFYKDCFGGEIFIMTVAETPIAKQMPPEAQNKVMHASLTSDQVSILISEMRGPEGFVRGNTVSMMVNCVSEAEVQQIFGKLSPGGNVMMAPGRQFWGAVFASFTDRFGIQWLLNYPLSQQ
ncbi:MAG: VOC family protein [Rhodospirillaceae bacterium]|nr:VOC family protein [Rhodospirillaceae bacterium]